MLTQSFEGSPVTSECKLPLLSEGSDPRDRTFCYLFAFAYLATIPIVIIVLACAAFGMIKSGKIVMTAALLPVMVRHVGDYAIDRRAAAVAGEPAPRIPLLRCLMWLIIFSVIYRSPGP